MNHSENRIDDHGTHFREGSNVHAFVQDYTNDEQLQFIIDSNSLSLDQVSQFVYKRENIKSIQLSDDCLSKVRKSHDRLMDLLEQNTPIYGVTTGFGDSCFRSVDRENAETLQENLVRYLSCGTGETLSDESFIEFISLLL